MTFLNLKKSITFLMLICFAVLSKAQNSENDVAFQILNKAMNGLFDKESYAVYFKSQAFDLDKPVDVFSLPSYRLHMGGFMIQDQNKFEIQLGIMKALCDGKLMVMIDETSAIMVIDSLREKTLEGFDEVPDIEKLLIEKFGTGNLSLIDTEIINKTECFKIRCSFKENDSEVLYYVDKKNNKLVLIAEKYSDKYDVYLVDRIVAAPKNHNFSVNLPNRELEELYGYEVFDMRYTYNYLKRK